MKKYTQFAIRTVRDGAVTIDGKVYRPRGQDVCSYEMPYAGQLDGQRFAFGLYWYGDEGEIAEYISLWGTEEVYRSRLDPDSEEYGALYYAQPNHMEDGVIAWSWWITEKEHQDELKRLMLPA